MFCVYHVYVMNGVDYNRLGFSSGKYSESATKQELSYFHSTADGSSEKALVHDSGSVSSTAAGEHVAPKVAAV